MMHFRQKLMQASHPVRVRGLKLSNLPQKLKFYKSHPVRVRGLKPVQLMTFAID